MKVIVNRFFYFVSAVFFFSIVGTGAWAQGYHVDGKGVLRDSRNVEVSFYGVNYTTPFAHAFRMHKALGVDLKKAIDRDVYHFARLGFNAYRIHVWDVEISDIDGNLLNNEHLDLLDYLVCKLKERNIKLILTPMAYWGNGYPERDDAGLTAFSARWNKREVTRNDSAIVAQENYLKQFVNHRNPYTGLAYKDDPDMAGWEINNEPTNDTPPALATTFVNRMVNAIRSTGCRAPIFYNVSHNFGNTQAFYDAKIDGGTFQWYPSGLVAGHTRRGNFLPAVDRYPIPFDSIRNYNRRAKIVYEFDAADIADSYMYPAMVRSFREAGFQWVTQFAYDPLEMAWANTEYQTHFLNLAYSPQKAISMKIAGEAMRQLPRNSGYGKYPADTVFASFRVSYNEKLSELNSPSLFMYSGSTSTAPKDAAALVSIAGYGSSPIVGYEGTGAYFLDKLSEGVWRLEVMPDAVWLEDPFGRPSLKREMATVIWNEWPVSLKIPDLGSDFSYEGVDNNNVRKGNCNGGTFRVYPGVYILKRPGAKGNWQAGSTFGNIRVGEFVAPAGRLSSFKVLHQPAKAVTEGEDFTVSMQIVGAIMPDSACMVLPFAAGGRLGRTVPLKRISGYTYSATVPGSRIVAGNFSYAVSVYSGGKAVTFPASVEGSPLDWDYYSSSNYTVRVEPAGKFISIMNASTDINDVETYLLKGFFIQKSEETGSTPADRRISITTRELKPDNSIIVRSYIKDKVDGRKTMLKTCRNINLRAGKIEGISRISIGFITTDGYVYKAEVAIGSNETVTVPVGKLVETKVLIRPVAYPSFLPDSFSPVHHIPFDIGNIEILEISTSEGQSSNNVLLELCDAWLD